MRAPGRFVQEIEPVARGALVNRAHLSGMRPQRGEARLPAGIAIGLDLGEIGERRPDMADGRHLVEARARVGAELLLGEPSSAGGVVDVDAGADHQHQRTRRAGRRIPCDHGLREHLAEGGLPGRIVRLVAPGKVEEEVHEFLGCRIPSRLGGCRRNDSQQREPEESGETHGGSPVVALGARCQPFAATYQEIKPICGQTSRGVDIRRKGSWANCIACIGFADINPRTKLRWAGSPGARAWRRASLSAPPTDIFARLIGQWLSEKLGQQFVIDNRPGAGTNLGTEAAVNAPADGYTLLLATTAGAINATLYQKLNFNFIRDLAPIAGIVRAPLVMEVNQSFPAKTVPNFIAYAKANPGKINMASAGNGTSPHMFGELFKMMSGVQVVNVPYRGEAPALTDLLGEQVQLLFGSVTAAKEYIGADKVRPLAVTTSMRSEALRLRPGRSRQSSRRVAHA